MLSEIVSIWLLKRKGKETKTKCLMDGNWCNFSEISGSLPCPICTTLKLNEVLKSYLYSLLNFLWNWQTYYTFKATAGGGGV